MKANTRLVIPAIFCFALAVGIILPALTPDAGADIPNTAAPARIRGGYISMVSISPPPDPDPDPDPAPDDNEFLIQVDGEHITLESPVLLTDSRAYVPLYEFCRIIGPAILMQDDDNTTILLPGLEIVAVSDSYYITANARYLYAPTLCKMIDNVMYVPVRTLLKAFGAAVTWDGDTRTVVVSLTNEPFEHGDSFYNETDLYWMSRIISAEARGECITGKIAVGNVVMNRLRSSVYPDTVRDVIFDKRCGIQFSPAYSGSINRTPDPECIIAAKLALDAADVVGDSMYFNATRVRGWAARHRTFIATIGNHNFYA